MAATRTVGLVSVGIDTTVVLRQLAGAASGARRMADWLEGQRGFGVEPVVRLLTDEAGAKVSVRQVQDATNELVDRGDLDLLVLYFAGHGIVKAGNDEQVLLSEVGKYKNEAVNVVATVQNARYSTVPHVIVISDACRNAVDPFGSLGTVAGMPALERRAIVGATRSKVDEFYATEPSQTAKEIAGDGLFTEVLLQALTEPPPTVWEAWDGLPPEVAVVPAWKLEDYLGVEVPLRAASHRPPISQTPDIETTSREPKFFGYAKAGPAALPAPPMRGGPSADPARTAARRQLRERASALDEIRTTLSSSGSMNIASADALDRAGVANALGDAGGAPGRISFETRTGYSVIGGRVAATLLSGGGGAELLQTEEGTPGTDVRLYPPPFSPAGSGRHQRGSVALIFDGGTVGILPILPGYIGTLHLSEGRIASLSFEISAQLRDALHETEAERREFAQRRALAAALSASGKLRRMARDEQGMAASVLRQSKRADPTLGIYAAYAYALAGNDEGARSVNDWFRGYPSLDPATGLPPSPVPFDVSMLARDLSPGSAARSPGIAPFCPLMTLGWSLLPSYLDADRIHPAIVEAGRHRLNAEWTTFRQQDVQPLLDAFERGELQ